MKSFLIPLVKYVVIGKEAAPTTGTPHLQGFFSLTRQSRITTLQKKLTKIGIGLSLLEANGSPDQNRTYCTKDNDFWEYGDIKLCGQGSRTELKRFTDDLGNRPLKKIAIELENRSTYVKYHAGLEKLERLLNCPDDPPEDRDISVSVFWGPGGTGKTRRAVEWSRNLNLSYYICPNPNGSNQWWDDYKGQKILIIDDFYGWISPHVLYRLLDRYLVQLPIKGSHTYAHWVFVIITSNVEPAKFYKDETMNKLDPVAFFRRFHNVYHFLDDEVIVQKQEKPFTCIDI